MSDGDLQVALAHLLVDDQAQRSLREDPESLGRRFGLSGEQLRVLRNLDMRRLELTARVGRAKRLDFLRRGLPATLDALELTDGHGLLHEFVQTVWAPVEPVGVSRSLGEGHRFSRFLRCRGTAVEPAWLHDLARFELVTVELVADAEASAWAGWAAERAPADDLVGAEVVLGRHVRVETFTYDVIALLEAVRQGVLPAPVPSRTHVTVVRQPRRRSVATYRTGETLAELLRRCTRPRPLAEALAADSPADRGQAAEALRRALAEGVLLVAG
jgi:hypothetical protein